MSVVTSEYYPPLELEYLEDLLGLSKTEVSHLVGGNEIKTKKMGNKIYVSNHSLNAFMDKVPKDRKEMEKRIIDRKVVELKEDKILLYAHYIKIMRNSNKKWFKRLMKLKSIEYSDKLSFTLNSRIDYGFEFEEISLEITDEEMEKIISDVKKMDLWVFDK